MGAQTADKVRQRSFFFAKKEKIWYNRDRKKQGETAYDD